MSKKEKKVIVSYRGLPSGERANGASVHGGATLIGYADGSLFLDYRGKEKVLDDLELIEKLLANWLLTSNLRDDEWQREYNEDFGAKYDVDGNLTQQPKYI